MSKKSEFENYLRVTKYFDYNEPSVVKFVADTVGSEKNLTKNIINLYYRVRDGYRYNPYLVSDGPQSVQASYCLKKGQGYCLTKAVLLGACARYLNVPSRLGLADVKNHLASPDLIKWLGTDLFIMHGFIEMYLDGKWVKATPAFNKELCEKFGVKPLEFDGVNDSVFQEFTDGGQKYMQFVHQHGTFDDVPIKLIGEAWAKNYPRFPKFG